MKKQKLTRRAAIVQAGVMVGAGVALESLPANAPAAPAAASADNAPFLFCLNTATIRGQKLGLAREIEIAGKAGYQGIEPWISSIEEFVTAGGTLKEAGKRIADAGLTLESAIGFSEWIVDDDTRRSKGLERAKHELDMVAQMGGKRLAAPPAGATNTAGLDWFKAVERYRALLEAGDHAGVIPQFELWGFSKNLNHLGQCVGVAVETGHAKACVLADVFHLYKGGSDFRGMSLLAANTIQVLHMNDYPAEPSREKINDGARVYPGDGTAPLTELLRTLHHTGGRKVLSLEVFNRTYWEQDPLAVARTGLEKMKSAVQKAMS